jgi:lia operon protein LiaI
LTINREKGFAFILILLGGVILLDKLGMGMGGFMSWILPIAMFIGGYYMIKHRAGIIGWPLVVFGGLLLFGKLMSLIGWLIAIVLIIYGVHLLNRKSRIA